MGVIVSGSGFGGELGNSGVGVNVLVSLTGGSLVVSVTVIVSVLVMGIFTVSVPLVVVIYVTNTRLAMKMTLSS